MYFRSHDIRHQIKFRIHTRPYTLVCRVLRLHHEIRVLTERRMLWKLGNKTSYKSVSLQARYIFFHCWAGLDEVTMPGQFGTPWQLTLYRWWVFACARIVEPFKHLFRVTANPQFLLLELREPMGAFAGLILVRCIVEFLKHTVITYWAWIGWCACSKFFGV